MTLTDLQIIVRLCINVFHSYLDQTFVSSVVCVSDLRVRIFPGPILHTANLIPICDQSGTILCCQTGSAETNMDASRAFDRELHHHGNSSTIPVSIKQISVQLIDTASLQEKRCDSDQQLCQSVDICTARIVCAVLLLSFHITLLLCDLLSSDGGSAKVDAFLEDGRDRLADDDFQRRLAVLHTRRPHQQNMQAEVHLFAKKGAGALFGKEATDKTQRRSKSNDEIQCRSETGQSYTELIQEGFPKSHRDQTKPVKEPLIVQEQKEIINFE